MVKQTICGLSILMALLLIFACESQKQVEIEVEVKATLDGKALPQANVSIDGTESGTTDGNGFFSKRINRLPGAEVSLTVQKDAAGYRIQPWKDDFVVKIPAKGTIDTYPFKAELKGTRFITILVTENDTPLEGAAVQIDGKTVSKTDNNGEYVHSYEETGRTGLKVRISKSGYEPWNKTVRVDPGQLLEVALEQEKQKPAAPQKTQTAEAKPAKSPAVAVVKKQAPSKKKAARSKTQKATVAVSVSTEAYGLTRPIPGASVRIDGENVGTTNAKGRLTYVYRGAPREAELTIAAPGYIPETWRTDVSLKGKRSVQRFFYPASPKPIKVGMYGYINNTPENDLSLLLEQIEVEVSNNFKRLPSFRLIPKDRVRNAMLDAALDVEALATKGWQRTSLIGLADMMINGSVAKDGQGYVIETSVIMSDGRVMLSQINRARSVKEINRTAGVIVNNIMAQFPFEGTVTAVEADGFRINLGKSNYRIRRGSVFRHMAADLDEVGRVRGFRETGSLQVIKTDDEASWAEIADIAEGQEIKIGDKVVRTPYLEQTKDAVKDSFVLKARGGFPPDQKPLWGVNVYLNNTWVGTTGSDGSVEVPVRLFDQYDLLLTRPGYQQLQDTLVVDENKQVKEYYFEVANAVFNVESDPSGAEVYIDGALIGKTPMIDGKLVNFGFRKVRLSVGGDYRDWEKVIEFNSSEVNLTGSRKVKFLKDWMKIGRTAEQNGQIDSAIQAYASTERANPDYSRARHRLAQLYMDEKNDYETAVKEFEKVLSLPENRQIIYKQYAVTYTNLGHAYYELGNSMILKDKRQAANYFAKAIQNLNIAKQNTRFFPNSQFDEAVHDTYYYLAISYHKLYLISKKSSILYNAKLAWREYFDFFPKKLESSASFVKMRNSARKYYDQIKDLS